MATNSNSTVKSALLSGGRYLAALFNQDSVQAIFQQKIIKAINQTAANAGVGALGDTAAPPPVEAVNVTASGEQVHVSLLHTAQVSRPVSYFTEIDTNPAFGQPIVYHHGSSRTPPPITLPTYTASGTKQTYYLRSYAQYPGSKPSPPSVFGGLQNPASITLNGQTHMDLLPSTGSGTASPYGQQGGSGFGKYPQSTSAVGQAQANSPGVTAAENTEAASTVGSLTSPSAFLRITGSFVTPGGTDATIEFTDQDAGTVLAGPLSGPAAAPTFQPIAQVVNLNRLQTTLTFAPTTGPGAEDTTAQLVITGQSWVSADSIILATIAGGSSDHPDPDEATVSDLTLAVGDLVVGVGFTVTASSSVGAYGSWFVNICGL